MNGSPFNGWITCVKGRQKNEGGEEVSRDQGERSSSGGEMGKPQD
jgi:hypothetical protein